MNKKITYLFLALLLPGLIFLFLKYFGKNEFDIPVYYVDGAGLPSGCPPHGGGSYYVSDSVLRQWNWSEGSAMIASFGSEKETIEVKDLIRDEKFEKLQLISLSVNDAEIKKCVLFIEDPWNAVLIDSQKRIRGYYKLGDRDEMDRLEVELKILLKKY